MNLLRTTIVLVAFGTGAALAGSALGQSLAAQDQTFAKTCTYLEKRSTGYGSAHERDWVPILANSCASALTRLRANQAAERDRDYLTRLSELKTVVIGMNMSRFTEDGALEKARHQKIRMTVSGSGEFLIAHYMGVMTAYRDWAEATGFETAALPQD